MKLIGTVQLIYFLYFWEIMIHNLWFRDHAHLWTRFQLSVAATVYFIRRSLEDWSLVGWEGV